MSTAEAIVEVTKIVGTVTLVLGIFWFIGRRD
jgi:hypothetical protein